ncbi:hypothetical protein [Aeromonas veronii]|uniref:Uncharacterized protein n=1 Tax=Aeromonas veronii AMC34 TaxID=1073383 RepID=K1J8R0_AERVE|nr:hypothetical protein [Aeromonas veronii]EKB22698.1 hypothetical protein HMPREF1168_00754 [Aeromonas veronii AMC34]
MAPRKKADEKSMQLAAAAVGAGTEPVSAQAEPKKDGVLVDPDAETARLEAEQQAAEEARLAAEAQAAEAARLEAEQQATKKPVTEQEINQLATDITLKALGLDPVQQQQANADWLLGQFDVKAKSPAGFWRCRVQFLHSSPTRVFVVSDKADVPHDHDCSMVCCYLTREEARRVHQDPWLTVLPDSEVIKD